MSQWSWKGVFPAATTQFAPDLSLDLDATGKGLDRLIRAGVQGLVLMGTVGEGNSLEPDEKRALLKAAVKMCGGRVPLVAGVSEMTTAAAVRFASDAETLGADALMVLPAMVYVPTEDELVEHFRSVAGASDLPVMLYSNPAAYRVGVSVEALKRMLDIPSITCLKESSADTARYTDLFNAAGERLVLFAGLDDVVFEAVALGAKGWVSGLADAFPRESLALWSALASGDLVIARAIYRWFMPLLHLDAGHDLVQAIKLVETKMGFGSERVRPPRYPLSGMRRAEVVTLVERALAARSALGLS